MSKRLFTVIGVILLTLAFSASSTAQTFDHVPTGDEPGTVYAVFFYSPSCPHCHTVIDNTFPEWYASYGDNLVIVPVNVTVQGTSSLLYGACEAYNIPDNRCGSVPLMLIGETWMMGSVDIPQTGTMLIESGLEADGIPLPDFPGMSDYFSVFQDAVAESLIAEGIDPNAPVETAETLSVANDSLADRLAADPVANAIAVVVLIGLVFSLGAVMFFRDRLAILSIGRFAALFTAIVSVGIALSLVSQVGGDSLATPIAWAVLTLMGFASMLLVLSVMDNALLATSAKWSVPLIALAGLGVAVYLTHVETTATEAVCGAIGNCNAVQQSEYAQILGVPIGVLGVMGYALILLAWGVARFVDADRGNVALLTLVGFGAIFSVYLTFLEPFVIGATCAWCLMSALTMLLLLWLVAPAGFYTVTGRTPAASLHL